MAMICKGCVWRGVAGASDSRAKLCKGREQYRVAVAENGYALPRICEEAQGRCIDTKRLAKKRNGTAGQSDGGEIMADDRLWLKCKECGEKLFLGKFFYSFEGGFYWQNYGEKPEHLEDGLNAFYNKHFFCGDRDIEQRDGPYYGNFKLIYEAWDEE